MASFKSCSTPSAAQGQAKARLNLGAMYLEGQGVAQDFTKARELFELAAAQGYAESSFSERARLTSDVARLEDMLLTARSKASSDVEQLRDELAMERAMNKTHTQSSAEMKQQLQDKSHELDRALSDTKQARTDLQDVHGEKRHLEIELEKAQNRMKDFEVSLAVEREEKSRHQSLWEDEQRRNAVDSQSHTERRIEMESRLRGELTQMQALADVRRSNAQEETGKLLQQVQDLEAQLEAAETKIRELKDEKANVNLALLQANNSLEKQKEAHAKELFTVAHARSEVEGKCSRLEKDLEDTKKDMGEMQHELNMAEARELGHEAAERHRAEVFNRFPSRNTRNPTLGNFRATTGPGGGSGPSPASDPPRFSSTPRLTPQQSPATSPVPTGRPLQASSLWPQVPEVDVGMAAGSDEASQQPLSSGGAPAPSAPSSLRRRRSSLAEVVHMTKTAISHLILKHATACFFVLVFLTHQYCPFGSSCSLSLSLPLSLCLSLIFSSFIPVLSLSLARSLFHPGYHSPAPPSCFFFGRLTSTSSTPS